MSEAPERIWAWEYKGNAPWGLRKPDLSVVTNGAEYVRADLFDAVMAERDAFDIRVKMLAEALKPFSHCVFDDNGDVTILTANLKTHDWLKVRTAYLKTQDWLKVRTALQENTDEANT